MPWRKCVWRIIRCLRCQSWNGDKLDSNWDVVQCDYKETIWRRCRTFPRAFWSKVSRSTTAHAHSCTTFKEGWNLKERPSVWFSGFTRCVGGNCLLWYEVSPEKVWRKHSFPSYAVKRLLSWIPSKCRKRMETLSKHQSRNDSYWP
jgi:hypothetical protein